MPVTDAAGKTSSLVYCILKACKDLQGKKDLEGHNPRIILGSKNLTFMMKTSVSNLEQTLRMTGTPYTFDKKNNIITVGTVEIYLIPLENPENVYGFSCCFEESTLITTLRGDVPIKDIKVGDLVLTTKGFKKVKNVWDNGYKDCIEVNVEGKKILCTPDHRFIDSFDNEIIANDLTKTISLVKVVDKEWQKCLKANGLIEQNLKLLTSMVSDTTDTLKVSLTEKEAITLAVMETKRKVSQLCTEICGDIIKVKYLKDMIYTTKTEILLITLLKTLSLLQNMSTKGSIGLCRESKEWHKLLILLKKLKKEIKNFSKMMPTEKREGKWLEKQQITDIITANAECVESNLLHTLQKLNIVVLNVKEKAQMSLQDKADLNTMKQEFVSSVEKNTVSINTTRLLRPAHLTAKTSNVVGQYKVYDLEIEDVHEYFANGIRVHNCSAFLDELSELPPDVCMEAIKSVNDRIRQKIDNFRTPFIISVSSAQGLDGQYLAMEHFKKNGMGYVLIRGETRDNVFLDKSYVENLYKIYNEKERKVYLEGHFLSVNSSLVFNDYDPIKNKLDVDLYDTLEPDDTVYIGQDFNIFFGASVACVVKNGAIVVIKDYKIQDLRRAPEIFRYDFPTQKIVWIPDATATSIYTQFKKELRAKNIRVAYRKSNPLVQDRVFVINKLLYSQRMFITPITKEVEKSMLTHQFDIKTGAPAKGGENAPDHISDALGYAVYHIMCWCKELKDVYEVTLGRTKMSRLGSLGQEVDADYRLLNPAKIAFDLPTNVDDKGE